jgi:exodeoxyribonuclease III
VKIATFNINNINRRLPNLLQWLETAKPDVVCLQELKAADKEFPDAAIARAGYRAVRRGQKTWNGVAILSRGTDPIVTRTALPGDPDDTQSRYLEAAVDGVLVGCIYLPNGNPQPGPKFDYKLAWFRRLHAHVRKLLKEDVPAVLARRQQGDARFIFHHLFDIRRHGPRHSYCVALNQDAAVPSQRWHLHHLRRSVLHFDEPDIEGFMENLAPVSKAD